MRGALRSAIALRAATLCTATLRAVALCTATLCTATLCTMTLAGCTSVVAGSVAPAPDLAPQPVVGAAVRQALLDDVELSGLLDQKFRSSAVLKPRFGDVDALPDGWSSARPTSCIGAAVGAQRAVYRAVPVRDVAQSFWGSPKSAGGPLTGVAEAVIALPTASDAQVAFERFAAQWNRCAGITLVRAEDEGISPASADIGSVETGNSVITASVRISLSGGTAVTVTRALGVRVNCLVDVDIFGGESTKSDQAGAAEVARAMLDKVSFLAP